MDTRQLHKGEAWINGRTLGRFWFIGPQFALFTPGSWLHRGDNSVIVVDLMSDGHDVIQGVKEPIF